jgi:hypothetical protein
MAKSSKAAAKRQTVASVAAEVGELRAGLGEVLSILKGEAARQPAAAAAEPQVTDLPSPTPIRDRRRRVGVGELRGGEGELVTISAAAERARERLRGEFRQLRAAIGELLEDLPEEQRR